MKVYVGNLPFTTTNKDLSDMFAEFGTITEAVIIINKFSGRSKGFGFVTFADAESAKKAIEGMNGKDVQGRQLVVNEAKPMEPRADGDRPRRSFGDRGDRGGFGGGDRDGGGFGGGFRKRSF